MYTYVDRQCQYSVLNQIKSYYIKLFFDFTPYQIIYIYIFKYEQIIYHDDVLSYSIELH